mgnify:CR=1 FL=1
MDRCSRSDATRAPLSDKELRAQVDTLKALANPVRLRMVDTLRTCGGDGVCVCEFTDRFDLTQPTITHHLKVLRDAGLIASRQEGTFVYYRIVPDAFLPLADTLTSLVAATPASAPVVAE